MIGTPCPNYHEGQPCLKAPECPVNRYVMDAQCNSLTPGGIMLVQAWRP